jgi:hypothetical protein
VSDFEPIRSQDQLDQIISKRVKDAKELREENERLKGELEARDKEMRTLARTHAVDFELARRGLEGPLVEGKIELIKRLIDLDSDTDPIEQLEALSTSAPDLFRVPVGAGSGGSTKPVLEPEETPLTEEDISRMGPEEMTRPGVMERVDQFLRGQR